LKSSTWTAYHSVLCYSVLVADYQTDKERLIKS
jgi:hypothetical protein